AENTKRIRRAIESGFIDILGHPTAMLLGKPGVPNYERPAVALNWDELFELCKKWHVALEFNCFPSRFDLAMPLLRMAADSGCWISFGSDAHSRAHLRHLNVAETILAQINTERVLNLLTFKGLTNWIKQARQVREKCRRETRYERQSEL